MAISLDLTSLKESNHTLIRNEVNRLRTKLGMSAYSWTALAGSPVYASDWNNTRAGMAQFNGAPYVGTLDLSGIPTKTGGLDPASSPVADDEYNGAVSLLAVVDSKCVDNANYANYPDYSSNNTVWNDQGIMSSNAGFAPNYQLN